jgi:hypothetical protein
MIERRDSPRRNTCFFRAFVYFENSSTAIDCIVRDLSDTGARLQFPKPQNLTELLDLHIPVKGRSFHAAMRWYDGDEIGIAFYASATTDKADISLDRRVDRLEAEISMLRQAVKRMQKHTDKNTEAA